MKKLILSATALFAVSALHAITTDEIKLEAKEALQKFGGTLQQHMKKNMKEGGVTQTTNFCSQEAKNIGDKINSDFPKGISIKRISLKPRNPQNTPSEDEKVVLEQLQTLKSDGKEMPKMVVKQLSENHFKVYKPIEIQNVCLNCHGNVKTMNAKAYANIKEHYPKDQAINYKLNDLRGAFVVEINKGK